MSSFLLSGFIQTLVLGFLSALRIQVRPSFCRSVLQKLYLKRVKGNENYSDIVQSFPEQGVLENVLHAPSYLLVHVDASSILKTVPHTLDELFVVDLVVDSV